MNPAINPSAEELANRLFTLTPIRMLAAQMNTKTNIIEGAACGRSNLFRDCNINNKLITPEKSNARRRIELSHAPVPIETIKPVNTAIGALQASSQRGFHS